MEINKKLTKQFIVKKEHSAKNIGSGDLEVLATPMLAAYMEETARDLLNETLSKELGSVGSNINIDHLAPSKIGTTIEITATITEIIKEKIIKISIIAHDLLKDNAIIGKAEHTRVIINNEKFLKKI